MSGRSIELGEGGDQVVLRFPYDTAIVTVVRGLSQRRFDQPGKCWSCPVDVIVEVVDTLLPHGFAVGASARELYAALGGTQKIGEGSADGVTLPPPKCMSIEPTAPTAASSLRRRSRS